MVTWRETPLMGVWVPLSLGVVLVLAGFGVAVMTALQPSGALYLSLPLFILASLCLSFAHYRYQDNQELYQAFYEACPELKGNLGLLATGASYADEGLQVFVYGDFW